MHDWPHRLSKLREDGTPFVIVTVAGVRGSAPRETGSKMLVTADGVQGTIGGGQLEHSCIAAARERLAGSDTPVRALRRFALGSQCGQCCGGVVDVLFEHSDSAAGWIDAAFAAFRAGARAALVTPLEHPRHREERSDLHRHREEPSDLHRHREERSDLHRHREERSDAAISQTTRRHPEIAAPAARARNDEGADEARSDAARHHEARNNTPRHREERSKRHRHREERSDAAISQTTRRQREIAAPATPARNDTTRVISAAAIAAMSSVRGTTDPAFTDPAAQRALRAAVAAPATATFVRTREPDGAARSLLVEPIGPPPLTVVLFGAGHVGRAVTTVLGTLDAAVFVVDSRPEQLQCNWPDNVTPAFIANPADFVAHCPPQSCYLVMTHDHGLDLDLCREILARADRRYCGLIGSTSKRRRFEKRLRAAGYDDATLESLTCPIGSGAITGKHPGEIAVAVAAELITLGAAAGGAKDPVSTDNVAMFPGSGPGTRGDT